MTEWQGIETAKLGEKVLVWHAGWRCPFPGTPNGDFGAVYVDTCEVEARGWQTFASHWMPFARLPSSSPLPIRSEIDL